METAVNVLIGISLVVLVGAIFAAVAAWRSIKREERGTAQALKTNTGGGGEPKEPA